MENVKWINGSYNGSYKEDNRIFDSEIQAEEWVDALYPDFGPYLFNKINVGYASPATHYRFPFLIHDLAGFNILKPDSNKDGEVGRFLIRIQDPKAAKTYSSPLLYKKIVVLTNALVCTTNLSMFLME